MSLDAEILEEFVVESAEHLANVESQLLEIERAGADVDVDLVNTVFRAVHSVKGGAGFLGLTVINELAHNLENVLNQVRNLELVPTEMVVERLLRSADLLRSMIDDVDGSNQVDVAQHVAELKQILDAENLSELDDQQAESDGIGGDLGAVQATVESGLFMPVQPDSTAAFQYSPHQQELINRLQSSDAPQHTETPLTNVEVGNDHESQASPRSIEDLESASQEKALTAPKTHPKPKTPAARTGSRTPDANLRVNVSVLDRLMNLAGELVLGRNQLTQCVTHQRYSQLESISARLDHVTSELQEAIMQTRMQPVGTIFNRFPRVVRDLSGTLGKQCQLLIEGGEVEVDKTIIEAIGDPLTHLVRNSVDHGVESPEKRKANGKPTNGTIRLRAFHQAGKVCIRIEDDGGGIDPEKVKQKALANRLIDESEASAMSDSDALRLIFAPGFSTAAQVTDISGRGVGMDVVRTNIEQIGGTVEVESDLGIGSAIHITLPLTLAIIPSMIVGKESAKFAIPQLNISELVRITPTEAEARLGTVQGAAVLRLRGDLLPLVHLEDVLGLDRVEQDQPQVLNIIVVESGQLRYGLSVGSLFDNEEIVVKPLGKRLKSITYLAGATILGDGHVALILDIAGIGHKANVNAIDLDAESGNVGQAQVISESHRMLLFSSSEFDRFAVPMAIVARIERVQRDSLREIGGRLLLPYGKRTLPLLRIENFISVVDQQELPANFSILIYSVAGREFGLVAPTLNDIRNVDFDADLNGNDEPGVTAVVMVDDEPTRMLDVVSLAQQAYPELMLKKPKEQVEEKSQPKRILVVEDSAFFLRHLEQALGDEGYEVHTAVDGQLGWDLLQSMDPLPDVVVTDIEMPNMDGLAFCRCIRDESRTKELPVIALTSLASSEDVAAGKAAGIDDYQIKLDRESLMTAVASYCKNGR